MPTDSAIRQQSSFSRPMIARPCTLSRTRMAGLRATSFFLFLLPRRRAAGMTRHAPRGWQFTRGRRPAKEVPSTVGPSGVAVLDQPDKYPAANDAPLGLPSERSAQGPGESIAGTMFEDWPSGAQPGVSTCDSARAERHAWQNLLNIFSRDLQADRESPGAICMPAPTSKS
jgi:hypothetical protein